MAGLLRKIIGPRVPIDELTRRGMRYRLPTIILTFARLALLISIFMPYWEMDMEAPQYPDGLHVTAYINRLVGDVREVDTLNHYIGMRKLEEAAQLERSTAIGAIIAFMLLVEGAGLVRTRWAALLVLPAIVFPVFFLGDLYLWLSNFGQNLDPGAPLSNSVEPFTPPVLGVGIIGNFKTIAMPGVGLILACCASVLSIVALYFHRRAYKPLVDAQKADPDAG